jgi:hypothetical protein
MKSRYYCTFACIALGLVAFHPDADAATISITSQTFTGNAPVLGTPTPASHTGVFSQSVTGSVSGDRLSPYAFNNNGTTNAPYSILSEGSAGAGSATYNVGASSFTLLWGSPDTYNIVQFWSGTNGTGSLLSTTGASGNSYIGSDLACFSTTCNQTLFDLVTFTDATGTIGSVVLSDSGTAAFEYGATPIPAALPLFATGIGAMGLLGWRRRRKAQVVA